jgi:DNA-binding response OmpR family regulator
MMARVDDYEVILVESTAHAYSKIKRVLPDLVVVCLSADDVDGCRVLSMLALDSQTSSIPVLTHLTPGSGLSPDDYDVVPDRFSRLGQISVN